MSPIGNSPTVPVVSVITVCLNAEKTLRKTIESVVNQSYPAIEYCIIDGGSTDGTMRIAREYSSRLAHIVSEPDKGISDAFNKGLRLSCGEFVQFLNADDYLDERKIERSIDLLLTNPSIGFVFGDVIKVSEETGNHLVVSGDPSYEKSIDYVMPRINHPTILARRSLFERYGAFDARWTIAMDYDWLLRIHKRGELGVCSKDIRVYTSSGGISDRAAFRAFRECRDISIQHGLNIVIAYGYYLLRCMKQILFTLIGLR